MTKLAAQPVHAQTHILLMVATMDLRQVKNLSALLNTLISEHNMAKPVCFAFLVEHCHKGDGCVFFHPMVAPGWMVLKRKWQLSWLDFDYPVMNVFLQKPLALQNKILIRFSRMRLRSINNLSAMLYSLISQVNRQMTQPFASVWEGVAAATQKHQLPQGAGQHTPMHIDTGNNATEMLMAVVKSAGLPGCAIDQSFCPVSIKRSTVGDPTPFDANANERQQADVCMQAGLLQPPPLCPRNAFAIPRLAKAPAFATLTPHQPTPHQPLDQHKRIDEQVQAQTLWSCGTERVIHALFQASSAPPHQVGWEVLRSLWGIGKFHFTVSALEELHKQTLPVQEHILFSIAAMDLHQPHDLTGLLEAALAHCQRPLCWRYLAALCPESTCHFHHPPFLPAWDRLLSQGISHVNIEYAVLNVFFMLPSEKQEQILNQLTRCPSLAAHTISGLMLQMVEGKLLC
eukprot:GGOE01033298.1.p1 GENE.GGOE01033298.1~~GGOE01033298.1.p1  ORF type:complete len:532 (+),score=109.05 GGOE01033298.1:227-1597(+)